MILKRRLTPIFILFLCTFGICPGITYAKEEIHKIIVIHSYEESYAAYPDFNSQLQKELSKQNIQAKLHFFYLDCEQYREKDECKRMYDYIDSIQSIEPDLILVNDDQATYSLLKCAHPFIRQIPIVFGGVNFPNWNLIKKYPNLTGYWSQPDFLKNRSMVERLFGKSRIQVFADQTYLGNKTLEEMKRQLAGRYFRSFPETPPRSGSKDTIPTDFNFGNYKIKKQVNFKRPQETFFIPINIRYSVGNQVLWTISGMAKYTVFLLSKYDYTSMRMGRIASIPTFSVINEGFGCNQGILGGYFTTQDIFVKEEAGYIAKILKGEKASNLPILQSSKKYVLDWEEMKRWNIPLDAIPDNYEIINIPFYKRHQTAFILCISVLSISIISIILYLIFLYARESKRKREALLNLWKEKEFLSLVLEDSSIFAWRYDLEKDNFNFDKDFFDKLKMPPQTISLQQISDMILPEDRDTGLKAFYKVRDREQERISVQCRCDFNGKGHVWYEYRYINTMDSLGVTSSIIGLIINIQEYKDKETALIEAKDLATKAELKQSFLANMSHEIRTPLNAIVGFSNILTNEKELSEEEKVQFISIINKNCDLLLKLINDILEISRLESGNMTFLLEPCNLTSFMEDIYSTHILMMPEGVELQKRFPSQPISITTDYTRLKQVISNFVSNSTKFTVKGHITIGYQTVPEKKEIHLYVEDTGKGIPTEEQKMIFERFYKQDEFAQGTGLGLSISQVIIEKLGGKIAVESEEGKGSCFTVIFPYTV